MKTLKQTVKETVDFVYGYLTPHKDGITMNAKELGWGAGRVVSSLVRRGIIERSERGLDHQFSYKWVATMAPTKTLYDSINMELKEQQRRYNRAHSEKVKKTKKEKSANTTVINDLAEKTLEQRLNELYPVFDFDDEMTVIFHRCGYGEDEIAIAKSRRTTMNAINAKLREAYLLGRKEKEEYDETIQD